MKTTFSRAFFPAALVLLMALLLIGTTFQVFVRTSLEEKAINMLQAEADTVSTLAAAYYADGKLSPDEFLINLSVASRTSGADTVICDVHGKLLLCSDSPLGCEHQGLYIDPAYLQQVMREGCATGSGLVEGLYDDKRYVVSMPILLTDQTCVGIVTVSVPMARAFGALHKISDVYLSVSLLVVLISVVIMTVFTRRQSVPLRELAKASREFGHGKLDARVQVAPTAAEEIRELALSFNNMASSLQKSEYQRQEFIANVSHELKTPMTTIAGLVDGVLDGTIPPEKQDHYLQIVSDETKRLSRLVRSMLEISRLQDQGICDEKKTRFDVCECAGQVLITFEKQITEKNVHVCVTLPDHPVYTFADMDAITQVIYNLMDNAVKFCPAQMQLGLRVQPNGAKILVSIFNDGPTIPAEELPLVFDRFHKTDKSRSENRNGWGLGLYIVKTLVCSHGEDIRVTSSNGRTEFTFTLPFVN